MAIDREKAKSALRRVRNKFNALLAELEGAADPLTGETEQQFRTDFQELTAAYLELAAVLQALASAPR